uniref:Uncharacterized protein n=1 Tax=Glossina palpalis gambiensis TaxID=67801 RepID=A0A1B0BXM1_9MUSC
MLPTAKAVVFQKIELVSVPHGLKELKQLVHLNLKNNRLLRIPSHTLAKMSKLQYVFLNDNRIEQICSTQQLQSMKFIRMLNFLSFQEHENILYELLEQKSAGVTGDLDDFEVDEEEKLSDWENSIETSDLDSTDDSSLENALQDISILIPELSRYITNFRYKSGTAATAFNSSFLVSYRVTQIQNP